MAGFKVVMDAVPKKSRRNIGATPKIRRQCLANEVIEYSHFGIVFYSALKVANVIGSSHRLFCIDIVTTLLYSG